MRTTYQVQYYNSWEPSAGWQNRGPKVDTIGDARVILENFKAFVNECYLGPNPKPGHYYKYRVMVERYDLEYIEG